MLRGRRHFLGHVEIMKLFGKEAEFILTTRPVSSYNGGTLETSGLRLGFDVWFINVQCS